MTVLARAARCVAVGVGVALAFAAATYLGRATRPEDAQVALAWPAAGVGVSLLLLLRRRLSRAVGLVGILIAALVVNWVTGLAPAPSVLFGLVNAGHAVLGLVLVERLLPHRALRTPRDVAGLLLASALTALASGTASAAVAATLLDQPLWSGLLLFVVRNGGTMFVVVAVLCAYLGGRPGAGSRSRRDVAELVAVAAAGTGLYVFVFVIPGGLPLLFLTITASVWAGSRIGVGATAGVTLVWSTLAVTASVAGLGALGGVADLQVRAVLVQAFVVVVVLVGLSLATGQAVTRTVTAELARSLDRLREATDAAVIGKAVVVRGADGGWTLTQPNPSLLRLLRRDPSQVRWRELLHPDDSRQLREVLDRVAAGEVDTAELEVRHRVPGEGLVWTRVHVSLLPGGDGTTSVVAQVVDVSAQRAAQDRLAQLALHDPLTGLANRAHLLEQLGRMLQDQRVHGVGVLFLDLDRFKSVNDTLGHEAGDLVLRQVAEALRATLRPDDVVCRLGGDEFVACCPGITDPADADAVVARLEAALEPALLVDGRDVGLGVSTGVAVAAPGDDAASLLRRSDQAMYAVKRAGAANG